MANIKSAQKRVKQDVARKKRNLGRRTAVKTAMKKVLTALANKDLSNVQVLLKEAEAQMARAGSKGVLHKKTMMRKTSRLAKKVAAAKKAAQ